MAQEGIQGEATKTDLAVIDTPEERAKVYSDFGTTAHKFFDDNPAFVKPSSSNNFEDKIAAKTEDGKRVILNRVRPGQKSPGDWFLQDISLTFPLGATKSLRVGQLSYNFDPKDGIVRERIIDRTIGGMRSIHELDPNNQPISVEDAKRLTSAITHSTPIKI